jgi:hypothetical protein
MHATLASSPHFGQVGLFEVTKVCDVCDSLERSLRPTLVNIVIHLQKPQFESTGAFNVLTNASQNILARVLWFHQTRQTTGPVRLDWLKKEMA